MSRTSELAALSQEMAHELARYDRIISFWLTMASEFGNQRELYMAEAHAWEKMRLREERAYKRLIDERAKSYA